MISKPFLKGMHLRGSYCSQQVNFHLIFKLSEGRATMHLIRAVASKQTFASFSNHFWRACNHAFKSYRSQQANFHLTEAFSCVLITNSHMTRPRMYVGWTQLYVNYTFSETHLYPHLNSLYIPCLKTHSWHVKWFHGLGSCNIFFMKSICIICLNTIT